MRAAISVTSWTPPARVERHAASTREHPPAHDQQIGSSNVRDTLPERAELDSRSATFASPPARPRRRRPRATRRVMPPSARLAARRLSYLAATTSTPRPTPRLAPPRRRAARPAAAASSDDDDTSTSTQPPALRSLAEMAPAPGEARAAVQGWLNPAPAELPADFEMPLGDHLEELRERVVVAAAAAIAAVAVCFAFSKDLVVFLEAPVAAQGVRFLQLSPGEFFFTTLKVGGYAGVLLCAPTVIYELVAYVVPGLTKSERTFMAPVVFGSSLLFYAGLAFSYEVRGGVEGAPLMY